MFQDHIVCSWRHTEMKTDLLDIKHVKAQSGFTLIELMISLTLGLLIVAAAIQLFITGITSYKLQKAMAHIQDNASLGLNFIVDDIRGTCKTPQTA